ncbi:MAG: metalloregulator ArsR/SmtB family transcription factor [Candidatus Veblenbacteria bacterium]|nr:metalloregulator ArsR/SmtB family transcription factor [Candidatus Veblenbacteria bacterium]
MNELERTLKALANRRRLAMVRYLKHVKRANVGDIAAEVKLSFKATSNHLARLSAAEIVESDKVGLLVFYRLAARLPRVVNRLLPFI